MKKHGKYLRNGYR